MMTRNIALLSLLLFLATPAVVQAQIEDETFGFTFEVPEGFSIKELPEDGMTIYTFADREISREDPATLIMLQRLHELVDPNQRLTEADIPEDIREATTLEERTWQGLDLEVIVMRLDNGNGENIFYSIQLPLAGEAVQLFAGGPANRSDEVLAAFNAALEGFQNTQPLYEGDGE